MQTNLTTFLQDIQSNYKTDVPDVIVTGYHQVFPVGQATCADLTGINANELSWGRQQQQALNSAIQSVVSQYSFAKYAAINFTGHELCTTNSWVQGLNATAPYHPTVAGQQEYANQVVAAYRTFK